MDNLNCLLYQDGSIKYKVVTLSLYVFSKMSGRESQKGFVFLHQYRIYTVTVCVGKLLRVFNCLAIIIYSLQNRHRIM